MKINSKIAFLIMAHNNVEQLNIFINQILKYPNSYIFIHIDKKSSITNDMIKKDDRVIILKERVSVEWGDYSMIKVMNYLIESAHNYSNFDYYSFNSGNDMLVKPLTELIDFLDNSNYDAFLEVEKMPVSNDTHSGRLERIGLHYPKFMRKRYKRNSIFRYIRTFYMELYKIKIIKIPKDEIYYFGSSWFTVNSKTIKRIIEYRKENPSYDNRFIFSLCGDEIYHNTIIMRQTDLKVNKRDNLRYINWNVNGEGAGSPKDLTIEDYSDIIKSNKFFARKFNIKKDDKIIKKFKDI